MTIVMYNLNMDWNKEEIKWFRQLLGLTQEQMAKTLGVTQSYISHLERGKKIPNVLKRLLDCLYEKYRKEGKL
ncbi:helix-turn-helix [Thermodesulfovibrio aggregans]|uniref:Helix-turn-helix n=2 Tax=Thermodesulfovibrio aggregans TaxID=86166 RepID=A0A0U9HRQ2_9BACT|nr:helix-turn-helix [Thermodesulfovibrio aggregans]